MTDDEPLDKILEEARAAYKEAFDAYAKQADEYWDNLSYDDKLMAFYSVVKRIHKAEVKDRGSYRWALYDVFGFDFDAYAIGMDCGYMDIHNYIYYGIEAEKNDTPGKD